VIVSRIGGSHLETDCEFCTPTGAPNSQWCQGKFATGLHCQKFWVWRAKPKIGFEMRITVVDMFYVLMNPKESIGLLQSSFLVW
jgi:hypothetical protein